MIRKFCKLLLIPFSSVIIFFVLLVRFFLLIRFGKIPTERFGHLAANIEIYAGEKKVIDETKNLKVIDFFCFVGKFGNETLMNLIKKKYFIFPEIIIDTILYLLKKFSLEKHIIPKYSYGYDLYNLIYATPAKLKFTNKEIDSGIESLKKINIDKNDRIVTFYLRDKAYNSIVFNENNNFHDYRDSNAKDFQLTANYLSKNGYKVIRMGRHSQESLIENDNIFDYSVSNIRSDFLDIYISSVSNFFITTNTGMETVSTHTFKKNGVIVNFLPYLNINFYKWVPFSILLPKKIKRNNRLLTFDEIFSNELCGYIDTEDYKKENLQIINNSPLEILEATKEYLNYKKYGINFLNTKDLELQENFWKIYNKNFSRNLKFFKYINYYKKEFDFNKQQSSAIISPYFLRTYLNQ